MDQDKKVLIEKHNNELIKFKDQLVLMQKQQKELEAMQKKNKLLEASVIEKENMLLEVTKKYNDQDNNISYLDESLIEMNQTMANKDVTIQELRNQLNYVETETERHKKAEEKLNQ